MKDNLNPFDAETAALVEAGRAEFVPDEGAKARVERRLLQATAGERGRVRWARARVAIGALAIAASVALGAGLHALLRPAKPAPRAENPVPPSVRALGALGSAGDATGRALLDDAAAFIMRGDPARALDLLEEHARAHRGGPYVELREALSIEALVRAGRAAEARARAEKFSAAYPASLLGPAVADALARISDE